MASIRRHRVAKARVNAHNNDDGGSLIALVVALRALPRLNRLGALAYLVARELDVGTCPISEALYVESRKRREEHAATLEARRAKRPGHQVSGGQK